MPVTKGGRKCQKLSSHGADAALASAMELSPQARSVARSPVFSPATARGFTSFAPVPARGTQPRIPNEPIVNGFGPAAVTTPQSNLWRERLQNERWAATRAHPMTDVKCKLGRDARLRTEIDFALNFDERLRRPTFSTPRTYEGPIHKPRMPFTPAHLRNPWGMAPYSRGSQVATPVAMAGYFSTDELQMLNATFKNERTGTWG